MKPSPSKKPPSFLLSLCVTLLAMLATARAAENAPVFTIEPTKEFPRNSEGSFITLKSGRILYFYSQFYGGTADHSPARIVAVQSDDGGRTWDATPRTVVENTSAENVMSVPACLASIPHGCIRRIRSRRNRTI